MLTTDLDGVNVELMVEITTALLDNTEVDCQTSDSEMETWLFAPKGYDGRAEI